VILGDNIFQGNLKVHAERFLAQGTGARLLLKKVSDPHRFGVAEIRDGKVLGIEEKPKCPKSDFAIIGVYFYDSSVFDVIRTLKPSGRGELEITDVNNAYIRKGQLACDVLDGWWTDAGTFDSLVRASDFVLREPPQ
jgi:glucose-1-phosphate thymidylyltransferase